MKVYIILIIAICLMLFGGYSFILRLLLLIMLLSMF